MRFLHAVAGFILCFELPIPIYWLVLHPFNSFWRTRVRSAFWIAGLTAWTGGGMLLWFARHRLLAVTNPSLAAIVAGLALIGVEIYLLQRVERELGTRRLVGHAELTGTGEMFAGGLYCTCATRATRECSARLSEPRWSRERHFCGPCWRFGVCLL